MGALERLRKRKAFLVIRHARVLVRDIGKRGEAELNLCVLDPRGEHPPALVLHETTGKDAKGEIVRTFPIRREIGRMFRGEREAVQGERGSKSVPDNAYLP
jgi:hypothetical protein